VIKLAFGLVGWLWPGVCRDRRSGPSDRIFDWVVFWSVLSFFFRHDLGLAQLICYEEMYRWGSRGLFIERGRRQQPSCLQ